MYCFLATSTLGTKVRLNFGRLVIRTISCLELTKLLIPAQADLPAFLRAPQFNNPTNLLVIGFQSRSFASLTPRFATSPFFAFIFPPQLLKILNLQLQKLPDPLLPPILSVIHFHASTHQHHPRFKILPSQIIESLNSSTSNGGTVCSCIPAFLFET